MDVHSTAFHLQYNPFFKLINQVFTFQTTKILNYCFILIIILIKIYAFILIVVDMPQS